MVEAYRIGPFGSIKDVIVADEFKDLRNLGFDVAGSLSAVCCDLNPINWQRANWWWLKGTSSYRLTDPCTGKSMELFR